MDKNEGQNAIGTGVVLLDVFLAAHGIPPLASITEKIVGLVTSTREAIFAEKMDAFIKEPNKIDQNVRERFLASLENDREEFMKKNWVAIDRVNETEKAAILGKLLKALLEEKIKMIEYLELMDIMQRVYIDHIKYFLASQISETYSATSPYFYTAMQLSVAGLLYELRIIDGGDVEGMGVQRARFEITPIGKILKQFGV